MNDFQGTLVLIKRMHIVRQHVLERLVVYLSLSTFCLLGCSNEAPSEPACRTQSVAETAKIANAACVIRLDGQLLTISHRLSGKYDLPGGTTDGKESSACTAHRETWEETGFNVEVTEWLGENDQGMQYFACLLSGNFDGSLKTYPVPAWANAEVSSIQLIDPFSIRDKDWRFDNRLIALRAMFNRVPDSKPTE